MQMVQEQKVLDVFLMHGDSGLACLGYFVTLLSFKVTYELFGLFILLGLRLGLLLLGLRLGLRQGE